MNVLAIGAHGDDLEMFCGGTLARFAQRGDKVFMCVVTDGRGRPKGELETVVSVRRKEAQASADLIGAESVWLGIPDGGLWFNDDTRHIFIETIRACTPDLIITHPQDDYHPDHKTTSRLVLDAAQIARTANYPSQYAPHRAVVPIAFMEAERGIGFIPEEYVDISDVWETKLAMLGQHVSQLMPSEYDPTFTPPPYGESMFAHYARALGAFRGLAVNCAYAEGFRFWHAANRLTTYRVLP
jgi:LmbE family N-acetylglucosaminyl deacetylase